MQILITHAGTGRTRSLALRTWQLAGLAVAAFATLLVLTGLVYHFVFVQAAREGWPILSPMMRLVVRDEFAQRDRYMRQNLDAMAQKVGEMQASMVKLEAMGERVSGLAGINPGDLQAAEKPAASASQNAAAPSRGAAGGPFVPVTAGSVRSADDLGQWLKALDDQVAQQADVFTLIESRLFEKRLRSLMVPSSPPLRVPVGSGFGFRADPFSGRQALHTGLDFPADPGTPIMAAAGGVVIASGPHPQYGQMVELDHGNGLVTRYAHASKLLVKQGDLVKRDQPIAQVGSTGRSTGPHLHFEVLVEGVQQDPAKFLAVPLPAAGQAGQNAAPLHARTEAAPTAPAAAR